MGIEAENVGTASDRAKNSKAMYVVGSLTDWDRSRKKLNPRTQKNYRYNATVFCCFQLSTLDKFAS